MPTNGPHERVRVRGADLKREYYAEYRKVEDVHWWFVGRRRILLQVLDQYVGHNGSGPLRILDVGCGTGTMLTYLASFGKAQGVDIDAEAIGYCRERGLEDVRLGEASALPFDDSTFDLVTALDVVEHLDDDSAAFREAWRLLRPGGHLLVTVPAHRFLWGDQDEVNMHKRRYVSRELRKRLVEARFEVVRLSYMNALLLPPIAAARLLRRLEHRLRPRIQAESDFRYPAPGPLNQALGWVFGAEAAVLKRADIPFGVSILALARKPAIPSVGLADTSP
ncbi:MAG TPA: methyltransferase domain-containing protein [Candidatus Limnocylindrales bacterium]|nr:methyltransferase domain-containing protein [Candidatus Limnocylindrales bacterium]